MTTQRTESLTATTRVRHVAKPMGRSRENPPHLSDLREFVQACEGLPDDLKVRIDNGYLDEGGRRSITFEVVQQTPVRSAQSPPWTCPVHPGGKIAAWKDGVRSCLEPACGRGSGPVETEEA